MSITAKLLKKRFPLLLERFNRNDADIFLKALTRIDASPGQVLQHTGEPIDSLYLVWEGKLSISMMAGEEAISLGTLEPGEFFGAVALIEPGSALTTVAAEQPSVLLRLDQAGLKALRSAHSRIGGLLLRALSADLAERLRLYEDGMAARTHSPGDCEEFIRVCRPLMGIKAA